MKIAFIGSHCTGKTTTLKDIEAYFFDHHIVTEVIRQIHSEKTLPINEQSTEETQAVLLDAYLDILINDNLFISDRSILDVFSYTTWLFQNQKVSESFYQDQKKKVLDNFSLYDYVFYFPIEFELKEDGVRSIDPSFREQIAQIMEEIIKENSLVVFPVTGKRDKRTKYILELTNRHGVSKEDLKELEKIK